MNRITISDIAERAGLSKGAVSYALNDRPGVSVETRDRVLAIARELGWTPSQAARSLSRSHADAIGLVLARPARMLGLEPFYMEFVAGIEDVIAPRGIALMLHMVESANVEIATYEKWWAQRRVDGVLLVDLSDPDSRIDAIRRIGMPAVAVSSSEAAAGLPHVWTDDARAMRDALSYLLRLGHRHIARVGGIPTLAHTAVRNDAFIDVMHREGIVDPVIVATDFSGEAGARATRSLLSRPNPPSAIVYDNDLMAVAGLGVAAEMGVSVPRELSLLAWDDSPLCEITHPPLSAMKRDVPAFGAMAADLLMKLIDGDPAASREGMTPTIFPRGSTAPALG
jgi:DNA-binding LacI/PurR family transcriptional regulator